MNYTETLGEVGEIASNYSNQFFTYLSTQFGLNAGNFQIKLLTLIILFVALWAASKVTQSVTKVILMILVGLLIISTGLSIFV